MKLSEAIREWKRHITTHMAVEHVLTLRADINVFSAAVQALEAENEELKKRLAQYELFREVVGDPAHEFASLRRELHRVERENFKLRDFIELLLSCPRDSGECEECRRLNDLCAVELEAGKLGIEVNV